MNELQKLYDVLVRDGYFTKSFEEFQTKWQDPSYKQKVYSIASRDGLYTKSEDEFMNKYSGGSVSTNTVKKKESTGSVAKSASSILASSSNQKAPTKKPYTTQVIDNQWYEGKGEIYTNFPGKEGKAYRYDNGQWYEESEKRNIGGNNTSILKNQIKDPMRVDALNKQFKKQGGTEKNVFVGFPGKEQNEYRVVNGSWQRRTPENKTWVTLTNEGSITALNNHFKKNIAQVTDKTEIDKTKKDNLYSLAFNKNLMSINSKLIGGEEEEAVVALRKKFPAENGWNFEETGMSDKIRVTAPNGQKQTFILDNWTWDDDKRNAEQMIGWMEQNNLTPSQYEIEKKKRYAEREEARYYAPSLGDTTAQRAFSERTSNIFDTDKKFSKETQDFLNQEERVKSEASKLREESLKSKSQRVSDLISKYSDYLSRDIKPQEKVENPLTQNNFGMKLMMSYLDSFGKVKGGLSPHERERAQAALGALAADHSILTDINLYNNDIKNNIDSYNKKYAETQTYINSLNEKLSFGQISQEEFNSEVKAKQKELKEQETQIQNQTKVSDKLSISANKAAAENLMVQETKGSFGGGLTLSFIKGVASPLRLLLGATGEDMSAKAYHKMITDAIAPIWQYETSLEYLRSEERPDLYKAAFSSSESLGAMVPLVASGGTTLLGEGALATGTMTAAAFYPMSYYEMKDELENIDMPESDKVAISSIYGLISSAFESIGMEYAMGKINTPIETSIKRNILKNVLGKTIPKDAPKEYIDALVRNETKAYLANFATSLAGSSLVEGTTEGLQSLVGASIKESYDIAKGTDFFNNKGVGDVVKGALYESYLGALGGGMVHSIYTSADAVKRNRALNSKELQLLMSAAKTNGMSETLMANLKSDMLNGRITRSEAKKISNNFDMVRGNMNQMPDNLTPEAQSVSLSLMMERDKLNKQVQGKDPNLVKPQTERIAEINNSLQEIATKNAVQEQSTGEVPVQPTPGVSGEVAQGISETTTEQVAEEGDQAVVQEEVNQYLGEPTVTIVDDGELYQFRTEDGLIGGVMVSPTEFRIDGISANEVGKGQGSKMFESLINYLKSKGVTKLTTISAGEGAIKMHDKAVEKGLLTKTNEEGRTAEFIINQAPIAETATTATEETVAPAQEKLTVNPSEGYSFEYESENDIPAELKGVEPTGRTETKKGRGKNAKTTLKLTFTGQQLIDAGLATMPTEETVAPELETQLTDIYDIEQSGETLTPEQQKVVDDNKEAYNQVVSSKTLSDEVTSLKAVIEGKKQGPAFQLQEEDEKGKEQSKERKSNLEEKATALMEKIQPEIADEAYDTQEPTKGTVSAEIKENEPLTEGVPRRSIRSYIGKKVNLLMADLLKVDINDKTQKMGGAFFPLIPGLRGKVAWASIDIAAAKAIIRGAIKSQISMVYNMNPEAMMSNKVFLESVLDRISKLPDADVVFTQMMDRIQGLSYQKNTEKIHDVAKKSKTMDEFKQNFADLNVDQKAAIMKSILPEQGTDYSNSKINVFRTLSNDGITKQSMLDENVEQFAADLPAGALTMALNIVDENGNRPTEDTIDNFIITREQAIEMGLPIHENYPIYIKGNVDAILTETASFWDVLKDFKRSLDAKIANLIQKKDTYIVQREVTDKKGKKSKVDVAVKVYNNPNGTRTVEVFNSTEIKGEGNKITIDSTEKEDTDAFISNNIGKIKSYEKGGLYTAKEARSSTMRSASMKADSAFEIKEPTKSKYQQFVERLSKAFPSVSVVTSQEEFDAMIEDIKKNNQVGNKVLLTKNQNVYGAVYNGKLYLNSNLENYNTPIHEFGHIWLNVAKTMRPDLYNKGLALVRNSEYLEQIKNSPEYNRIVKLMQAQGFSQEEINQYLEEEALATAIGDKGESFVSAASKRSFNNWLNEVFNFVKKLTGISNVTAEELQNMTLDDFVQGVVVDLMSENQQFKDAEIESFGSQLQLMTGPAGLSMRDIIAIGRNAGFTEDAIRTVLLSEKFKAADIDNAMQVQINLTDVMPRAFGNIEGGAAQGIKLFNDVRSELEEFSRGTTTTTRPPKITQAERDARIAELRQQNPTLTEISDSELLKKFPLPRRKSTTTTVKPTMAEIRQKAKELLTSHPIFQSQSQTIQMELLSSFDKTLGTRANKVIQAQINAIRNNLKQRKIGAKELQDSKAFLRNFIRKVLPKSEGYSQKQINNLLNIISKSNENTIMRDTDKVLAIVEEQRNKMKTSTIKEMVTMAIKKAKPAMTITGKRRSAGLDAEGRSYFVAVGSILKAAFKGDQAFLDAVQQELNDAENDGRMNEAINKELNREKLTKKERDLLNKAMAYDTFSNIMNMELEQVNELYQVMKGARTQSIMNLAANRAARSAYHAELNKQASEQIQSQNPYLFKEKEDEDGNITIVPKDKNDLLREKKQIFEAIRKGRIAKGIRELSKTLNFKKIPYVTDFFRNYMYHLGTLMNIFDNNAKAQTFFTDNVYRPLNRMDEESKKGYYEQISVLNNIANSIQGITKGYKQIRNSLQTGVHAIIVKGNKELFNADALLRIYALSKNNVQREILNRMGFTDSVIDEIKTIVGPQAIEFADKVVDYLSNDYYESVNDVYSKVNDVNLGYVDNYFPTSKVKSEGPKFDPQDADFYGIFNAETAPSLHERTDKKSDIDLNFDFSDVLDNHFQNMERYKAHAEGVKTLNAIFQNPDVVAMLDATHTKMLVKNAINLAITPNFGMKNKQTFIGKLQTKMTGFALAFKVVQILKQSTSFIQSFEDYSFFPKDSKVPGVISRPMDYLGFMIDSAMVIATLPKQVRQAYGMSANVRDRLEKGIQGDVYGLESGARLFRPIDKRSDAWGRARRALKTGAAAPTIIGDVLGVMGYMVNYNRNIKNGMSQEEALETFNNYNATLQTRRSTEKSSIQMSNNELIRAFTMFGSTAFLQMNKVAQAYNNIMNSLGSKKMPAKNDIRALLLNLGAANALFVFASNLAKFIKGDDDDRDEALRQMKRAMLGLNLIENVPLIDAGIKTALNFYDGDEQKQEREVTNPFMTLWWKMKDGIKGEDTWKTVQPIIEMGLGAQFDPVISLYNGFNDGFDDEEIYNILGISKSYRPGAKKDGEDKKEKEMSKEDMKRYFPDMYEEFYGEGGIYYEQEQMDLENERQQREDERIMKDEMYGYEEPEKETKKKSSSSFGSGSRFGKGND